jgi:hypothetical protein
VAAMIISPSRKKSNIHGRFKRPLAGRLPNDALGRIAYCTLKEIEPGFKGGL